jgi:hypothetical protein
MRGLRLIGITAAALAFGVILLVVNYPYALHWVPFRLP